jgi:hypothetical protein
MEVLEFKAHHLLQLTARLAQVAHHLLGIFQGVVVEVLIIHQKQLEPEVMAAAVTEENLGLHLHQEQQIVAVVVAVVEVRHQAQAAPVS